MNRSKISANPAQSRLLKSYYNELKQAFVPIRIDLFAEVLTCETLTTVDFSLLQCSANNLWMVKLQASSRSSASLSFSLLKISWLWSRRLKSPSKESSCCLIFVFALVNLFRFQCRHYLQVEWNPSCYVKVMTYFFPDTTRIDSFAQAITFAKLSVLIFSFLRCSNNSFVNSKATVELQLRRYRTPLDLFFHLSLLKSLWKCITVLIICDLACFHQPYSLLLSTWFDCVSITVEQG